MDGSVGETGSGMIVVRESPEGHKLNCTVRFGFKATNNTIEYEALVGGLRLAKKIQLKRLLINSVSQLIVVQVNVNFLTRNKA